MTVRSACKIGAGLALALTVGCATVPGTEPTVSANTPVERAPIAGKVSVVPGADGVQLKVYEFGNPAGPPIVFVHGVNQAHIAWNRQFDGELAARYRLVAFDLRGHGLSDKPSAPAAYQSERKWAGDLDAVIRALALKKPVLVGWSFGGRVIAMYLRHHGDANVGAVNFVDTVLRVGGNAASQRSPQLMAAVGKIVRASSMLDYIEGQKAFVRAMSHEALPRAQFEQVLAFNMHVPPHVFKAVVAAGPFDYTPELNALRVPALVTHGQFDLVSHPDNGRFIAERVPGARLSIFEKAGHLSFMEDPARFNRELDALAAHATGRPAAGAAGASSTASR